jgi:hypothetical protein
MSGWIEIIFLYEAFNNFCKESPGSQILAFVLFINHIAKLLSRSAQSQHLRGLLSCNELCEVNATSYLHLGNSFG